MKTLCCFVSTLKWTKSLTKLSTAIVCSYFLGTNSQATTSLLGLVRNPSVTPSLTEEVGYVNTLVDMANGVNPMDPYLSAGHTFDMIVNPVLTIPTASPYGSLDQAWSGNVLYSTGSGYSYVMARFASNWGPLDVVYYSTDGAFSIPTVLSGTQGITHYTALRSIDNDVAFRPQAVPDGGSTFALLGLGALSFVTLRRKLKS